MDSLVATMTMAREIQIHERVEFACEKISQTPEYQTARAVVLRFWDEIGAAVVPETKGLLIQYESAMSKLSDIESTACYLQGLADAVKTK